MMKIEASGRWWVPAALWSPEARAHRRWRAREARADSADRKRHTFTFPHPVLGEFVYHPSDYLTRRIFLHDDFERAELQYAAQRAAHGGVMLDVGANVGLYTVVCARAAGSAGRVIALEPGPATFTKLRTTCERLHVSNVTLLQIAAGDGDGTALLVDLGLGHDVQQHLARPGENKPGILVAVHRLDDVCGADADAVALVKVDVEGHELAALRGAPRILANGKAHLIVEFNPSALAPAGATPQELWNLLAATHRCTAAYDAKGDVVPPRLESVAATSVPYDAFNTIWQPKAAEATP